MKATREAYGETLAKLIQKHKDLVVLDADLTKSTKTCLAQQVCPNRHFNIGIAEANMMGIAAGLAVSGKNVFASSFAIFAAGRAFEQIRNSIAYPKLNVKICATHAGISVGEDGATHQSIEDIAIMRVLPNMCVIQPCDAYSTEKLVTATYHRNGPCYVRLSRSAVENIYKEDSPIEIGKGNILKEGSGICVIASGIMVQEAYQAISQYTNSAITLIDMHTIKPLDTSLLLRLAKTHHTFITCEEHSILGGLGSAVAEFFAQHHPCKVIRIGVHDTFGESGKPDELLHKYGCDTDTILKTIEEASLCNI